MEETRKVEKLQRERAVELAERERQSGTRPADIQKNIQPLLDAYSVAINVEARNRLRTEFESLDKSGVEGQNFVARRYAWQLIHTEAAGKGSSDIDEALQDALGAGDALRRLHGFLRAAEQRLAHIKRAIERRQSPETNDNLSAEPPMGEPDHVEHNVIEGTSAGKMWRLVVGAEQYAKYDSQRDPFAEYPPISEDEEPPTSLAELDPRTKVIKSGMFTLPSQKITGDETVQCLRRVKSMFDQGPAVAVGGYKAIVEDAAYQEWVLEMMEELVVKGHPREGVGKVINHYEGEPWMLVGVTSEGADPFGPEGVAAIYMDGNEIGSKDSPYECTGLVGLDASKRYAPSVLKRLFKRIYFLSVNVFLCEVATNHEYVPGCCTRNMAVGICVVYENEKERSSPLVLCDESLSKDGLWKRMKCLWWVSTVGEEDCVFVFIFVILTNVTVRGWLRMCHVVGCGVFVRQSAGLCLDTPSRARRNEVVGSNADDLTNTATNIVARAAIVLTRDNAYIGDCVFAAAQVVGRVRTICYFSSAVATRSSELRLGVDEGESNTSERDSLRDQFYEASQICLRAKRLLTNEAYQIMSTGASRIEEA